MKIPTRPLASLSAPVVALVLSFFAAAPAHAHHAMDGRTAATPLEGFFSGLAHPVIGIDHLAMILAIGVLAAAMRPGFLIAAVFVAASMGGAGLHLLGLALPLSEELVSFSVLAAGLLLVRRREPARAIVLGLCAIGGALHGYAYAEAIFGAESTPLTAYLVGLTVIQLAVAGVAFGIAGKLRAQAGGEALVLRPAGYMVAGAGLALLATQLVALAVPMS
jgi:urease accessory protein